MTRLLCLLPLMALPLGGCKTSAPAPGHTSNALLRLHVTPAQAHIYINDVYQGRQDRWRDQSVPVTPGLIRLELRAQGYIPHRRELSISAHEELTLTYVMEPVFDRVDPTPEPRESSQ